MGFSKREEKGPRGREEGDELEEKRTVKLVCTSPRTILLDPRG